MNLNILKNTDIFIVFMPFSHNFLIIFLANHNYISTMQRLSPSEQQLMYQWMSLVNPGITCEHVHPDTSCMYETYYKWSRSLAKGFKFYLILHLIPFFLYKVKKIKDTKKFKEEMVSLVRKYIGSLFFMGSLVGGIKTFLCFSNKISKPEPNFQGKVFIWGSLFSSLSIFFQDAHRRQQIVYFVFVRAFRSIYIWAKKRKYVNMPCQEHSVFIILFGLLAFIFDNKKQLIKGQDLVQKLWGTA